MKKVFFLIQGFAFIHIFLFQGKAFQNVTCVRLLLKKNNQKENKITCCKEAPTPLDIIESVLST